MTQTTKELQIVKIDPAQYGVEESKAKEVQVMFTSGALGK